jgi:NitT/TauT family transport system permease protein
MTVANVVVTAKSLRTAFHNAVVLLVVPAVLVLIWAVTAAQVGSLVFPGPLESFRGLAEDLSNARFRANLMATGQLLLVAFALSAVVGVCAGFVIGLLSFWHRVLETLLYAVYSIPKITLYPIFLLFLGIGDASRISFAFFHGVFPMVLMVMGATARLDRKYLRLAAVAGLTKWQLLRKILLPALLPAVVTALRLSFGLTLLGLILAEMFSSNTGVGYELVRNVGQLKIDHIAGQVVLLAALAVWPSALLRWVEVRVHRRYLG